MNWKMFVNTDKLFDTLWKGPGKKGFFHVKEFFAEKEFFFMMREDCNLGLFVD